MPVTVDLEKSKDGDVFYDPRFITFQLNQAFRKTNLDIQVLKTVAIDGEFKPRIVKSRWYKLGVYNLVYLQLNRFLQRILEEIMKKNNTWNIIGLVNETIVQST